MSLYMDVHNSLPDGTTLADLAGAHEADLQVQQRYGVRYLHYWADEEAGKVFCLVDAPSADAAMAVHREAHGLVANKVREVTGHSDQWAPAPGMKLYLDRHELGPGKVTAKDVAAAHRKDLAVQAKHKARFLNFWIDEATGTVTCLVEAPTADAAHAVHREAHGLVADEIYPVVQG